MVDRVDMVPKGANQESDIVLFKSDDVASGQGPENQPSKGGEEPSKGSGDVDQQTSLLKSIWEQVQKLTGMVQYIKSKEGNNDMSIEEILKTLPEEQRTVLEKALQGTGDGDGNGDQEDVHKGTKDTGSDDTDPTNQNTDDADPTDTGGDDPFAKMDPIVKQKFESLEKENKEMRDQLTKMLTQQEKQEYVKKAGEYDMLPVQSDQLGEVLHKIAKTDEDAYKTLTTVLQSANEMAKHSSTGGDLFSEIGKGGGDDQGTLWDTIEKKAQEKMDNNSDLTKEMAITKVLEEDKDLRKRYYQESYTEGGAV